MGQVPEIKLMMIWQKTLLTHASIVGVIVGEFGDIMTSK